MGGSSHRSLSWCRVLQGLLFVRFEGEDIANPLGLFDQKSSVKTFTKKGLLIWERSKTDPPDRTWISKFYSIFLNFFISLLLNLLNVCYIFNEKFAILERFFLVAIDEFFDYLFSFGYISVRSWRIIFFWIVIREKIFFFLGCEVAIFH